MITQSRHRKQQLHFQAEPPVLNRYLNWSVRKQAADWLQQYKAAYKLVHDVMLVQPGENVVITGDTSTDKRVLEALMSAAYTVGAAGSE